MNIRKAFLPLALTAAMICSGMPAAASDETQSSYAAEDAPETETEETYETEKAEDVDVDDLEILLINDSGVEITASEASESTDAADASDQTEEAADTASEDAGSLTLVSSDGTEHIFYLLDNDLSTFSELHLGIRDTFLYINGTDESGESVTIYEDAPEITFDEPQTRYVINEVYIRSEGTSDSEKIGVAELGSAVTAVGAKPGWCRIQTDDGEGYISSAFLTENEDDAQNAVNQDTAFAQAQAAAAQAAAAAAAAQANAAASQKKAASSSKTEVSRQKIDDCDGSGHGYYIITYSDGSTSTQDY